MPGPDPGYGSNGERIDPGGLVAWKANPPPSVVTDVFDVWTIQPLAVTTIPIVDQDDDEGWTGVYPGGV